MPQQQLRLPGSRRGSRRLFPPQDSGHPCSRAWRSSAALLLGLWAVLTLFCVADVQVPLGDFLVWPQAPLPRGAEQSPGEATVWPRAAPGPPVAPAGQRPPPPWTPSVCGACTQKPAWFPASARNAHSLLLRSCPTQAVKKWWVGDIFPQGGHFWCQEKHMRVRCPCPLGAPRLGVSYAVSRRCLRGPRPRTAPLEPKCRPPYPTQALGERTGGLSETSAHTTPPLRASTCSSEDCALEPLQRAPPCPLACRNLSQALPWRPSPPAGISLPLPQLQTRPPTRSMSSPFLFRLCVKQRPPPHRKGSPGFN